MSEDVTRATARLQTLTMRTIILYSKEKMGKTLPTWSNSFQTLYTPLPALGHLYTPDIAPTLWPLYTLDTNYTLTLFPLKHPRSPSVLFFPYTLNTPQYHYSIHTVALFLMSSLTSTHSTDTVQVKCCVPFQYCDEYCFLNSPVYQCHADRRWYSRGSRREV